MQLECVVSAVGDYYDWLAQVFMQGSQDRQTRRARQSQAGKLFPGLQVSQKMLIGGMGADLLEKKFHKKNGIQNSLFDIHDL
jgi:hypothetical protein